MSSLIAVACPLVLTEVGTSFIDITSAIPVVLGIALLLKALDARGSRNPGFMLSGLCLGLATALKLTNAPFAAAAFLTLTVFWSLRPDVSWKNVVAFGAAVAAGFVAGYGYWGDQLWREFGNPVFPHFHAFFQPPESVAATPSAGVQASVIEAHRQSFLSGVSDWLFSSINRHQRFLPRDAWDWVLRPLYMVDPVANVYTEVRAPDARFLAFFCIAPFTLWRLREHFRSDGLVVLLVLFAIGWMFWMATSGNGRYLMPWALIVGPALVACASVCWAEMKLPAMIVVTVFVFVQSALLWEGPQYRWAGADWQEHYITANLPREMTDHPFTFVTIDGQSASWLSTFAHPESRFANPGGPGLKPKAGKGSDRFSWVLGQSREIFAIFRFDYVDSKSGRPFPSTPGNQEFNLRQLGLKVDADSCLAGNLIEAVPERTASFAREGTAVELRAIQGFFFCRAAYQPELIRALPVDPVRESAFRNIEQACPRQFPPGGAQTVCAEGTCWRSYTTTDAKVTIARDGAVTSRHYGAVQQPYMGTVDLLSRDAASVRCQEDLGRYSPWSPGANLLSPPISSGAGKSLRKTGD